MTVLSVTDAGRLVFSSRSVVSRDISPAGEITKILSESSSQSYRPYTRCETYPLVVTEHPLERGIQVETPTTRVSRRFFDEDEWSVSGAERFSVHFHSVLPLFSVSMSGEDAMAA
jgi:hypothetical protein